MAKLIIKTTQAVEEALAPSPTKPAPEPKRSFADALAQRIPAELGLILMLFVVTRAVLILIGVTSRAVLQPLLGATPTEHLWLNIWAGNDTRWYLDIIRQGYSVNVIDGLHGASYAFFPAYPVLVKFLALGVGNPYIAGLVLSNLCLLVAGYLLYKLTFIDADAQVALGAVKYLFLFPTAFLYSGFLAESLFLALLIGCFFLARRGIWMAVGITGFALALANPIGVIVLIPLLLDCAVHAHWNPREIAYNAVPLALIPMGAVVFGGYMYYLSGDPLALVHTYMRWYGQLTNPLDVLINGFVMGGALRAPVIFSRFGASFALAAFVLLLLLLVAYKRVGLAYWTLGMCLIVVPLATGAAALPLMPRLALAVFPLYIMLGTVATTSQVVDLVLTVGLALFQGFLMVVWMSGTGFAM